MLTKEKYITLKAAALMGPVNVDQLHRFLFDTELAKNFDMAWTLAELREAGELKQTIGETGIQYVITPCGERALQDFTFTEEEEKAFSDKAAEYRLLFEKERNYPAQYTEQANAIVPVFLSIRDNDKVLFKVNVIVHDVETAEKIKRNWMENAHKTYAEVWKCIAGDEPMPDFH